MADLFDEVEEQLRSDRYKTLALKALPWIAGALVAALLVALGIWGWRNYEQKASATASEQYSKAMQAFSENQPDRAYELWGEAAKSPSKAYKALSLMQQGAVRLEQGKTEEAVKLFDQSAAAAPNPIIEDAARLKSAFAVLDSAPYKDVEARLTPLTKEGRPYRVEAREGLAFAKLMAGDVGGARSDFSVLSLLVDASPATQERARAAMLLIDSGSAKAVPQAVKAAAALPAGVLLAPQLQAPGPQ